MHILSLRNIDKYYGAQHVVKNLNLDIREGEFLTILGPSGCGKTTTLRMIGGFELPSAGQVILRGNDISQLPPYKRNVNTVFQNYALFPHMTVAENIAFGLKQQGKSKDSIQKRVGEMLEMVRLESFGARKPQELSGGQQQRVAIARAVACDPDLLLLDEPLGALDLKLRKQMQSELKNLHRELGKTFIYVTHDQEEALAMSDRIAVMNAGVLEQVSDADELYYRPKTKFVADFIGEANILEGTMAEKGAADIAGVRIPCDPQTPVGQKVALFVRPESVRLDASKGLLKGEIVEMMFVGAHRKYFIQISPEIRIVATETTMHPSAFAPGQTVFVDWDASKVSYFS